MLQRGERLDTLVDRSNHLSAQSKMFYKTAKKVCAVSLDLARLSCLCSRTAVALSCRSRIIIYLVSSIHHLYSEESLPHTLTLHSNTISISAGAVYFTVA